MWTGVHGQDDRVLLKWQKSEKGRGNMSKDPVCGMDVDEKKAAATAAYEGQIYYFCAAACKRAFEKNPEKYLEK
jgi:YHS domain-containing protein